MDRDNVDELEALCNLIYLARRTAEDQQATENYLLRAEDLLHTMIGRIKIAHS